MKMAPHPALAHGNANHVGDAVAVVIAETLSQAKDAGREDQGRLRGAAGGRRSRRRRRGRARRRSTRSRRATRSISGTSATRRPPTPRSRPPSTSPSSTSSTTGWCRTPSSRAPPSANTTAGTDCLTLWNTTQNPHVARLVISAFVGMAPEHKLRVIAPDVGGGFGSKIFIYPEEVVCLWASRKVGRPVKWVSERTEAFLTDAHGRDHVTHAEMAFDGDGKITGAARQDHRQSRRLHVDVLVVGADLSLRHAAVGPVRHPGDLLRGRRGLHQHRAGRCLSRRRAAGSDLRGRAADRGRGARAGGRSRRPAQEELHQEIPAPDAGDHELRRRRLSRLAQEGAGDRRLRGLRQAQARVGAPRQAARHRLLDLHRGLRDRAEPGGRLARLRRGPVGVGGSAGQSDRLGRGPHRLPPARPGPRDHVRAGRLRAARHPDRERRAWCTATPTRCSSAWAPTARARARSASRRSSRRSTRSRPRPRRSPPTCWKRPKATSCSRTASSPSPAPTSRRPGATSRSTPISRTSSSAPSSSPA